MNSIKKQAEEKNASALPGSASQFEGIEKRCPKCGFTGTVIEHFGLRWLSGKRQSQSWCLECRRQSVKPKQEPAENAKPEPVRAQEKVVKMLKKQIAQPKHLDVPELDLEAMSTDELRALYQQHYPNDSHRRGPKIMRERLSKKLGLNQA